MVTLHTLAGLRSCTQVRQTLLLRNRSRIPPWLDLGWCIINNPTSSGMPTVDPFPGHPRCNQSSPSCCTQHSTALFTNRNQAGLFPKSPELRRVNLLGPFLLQRGDITMGALTFVLLLHGHYVESSRCPSLLAQCSHGRSVARLFWRAGIGASSVNANRTHSCPGLHSGALPSSSAVYSQLLLLRWHAPPVTGSS